MKKNIKRKSVTVQNKTLKDLFSSKKKNNKKLRYSEYLEPIKDEILEYFKPQNKSGYRIVHNPHSKDDFIPQRFMNTSRGRERYKVTLSEEDFRKRPVEKRLSYISTFSISNYDSPEKAEKMLQSSYKRILERHDREEAEGFINNIGAFIVKVDYKKEDGLIGQVNDKGHFDFLPYESFDYRDRLDDSFKIKSLRYED